MGSASTLVAEVVAQDWQGHLKARPGSDDIFYHVRSAIDFVGDVTVAEFRHRQQQQLIDAMLESGLAQGTVKRRFGIIKAALKRAHYFELLDVLPTFINVENGAERDRWIPMVDLRRLWVVDKPEHLQVCLALAMATSGRKMALLRLTRDRCETDKGWIDLHPTGAPRTKKHNAVVPMVPFIRPYVEAVKRGTIVHYRGEPISSVKRAWSDAIAAAEIKDFHLHDMRHTIATELRGRGVSEPHIQGGLGHKGFASSSTERYAHHRKEHLSEWAVAVEAICKEVTEPGEPLASKPGSVSNNRACPM